jgi:type II secretory pathway component PulK
MDSKQSAKGNKDCIPERWGKQRDDSSCNGYVLIFVLWAVAILGMVALGFSKDTRISVLLKSISAERMKDLYAARGASLYALVKLSSDDNAATVSDQQTTGAAGLITAGGLPTGGDVPISGDSDGEESDSEKNDTQKDIKWIPGRNPYSVQIGDIDCDVYLSSENGKININGINDKNREILVNFLTKRGIDILDADTITDSVLDWIDPDDLTHLNGAEDNYYGSLPDPYKSKDGPFLSNEELTLVQGITPAIFENIKDDITVYGDKKININVNIASKDVLSSIPGLSEDMVDELYLYIEENGAIKTAEELREFFWDMGVIGSDFEDVKPYLTLDQSDFVTISAISGGSKRMHTNVQNSYGGYDYKLIVGKKEKGYKIYAVYPE